MLIAQLLAHCLFLVTGGDVPASHHGIDGQDALSNIQMLPCTSNSTISPIELEAPALEAAEGCPLPKLMDDSFSAGSKENGAESEHGVSDSFEIKLEVLCDLVNFKALTSVYWDPIDTTIKGELTLKIEYDGGESDLPYVIQREHIESILDGYIKFSPKEWLHFGTYPVSLVLYHGREVIAALDDVYLCQICTKWDQIMPRLSYEDEEQHLFKKPRYWTI